MKAPILRPPVEAVLFGFERIGMVVRLAWLPIVLCLALYAAAFVRFAEGPYFRVIAPPEISASDATTEAERLEELAAWLEAAFGGGGVEYAILESTVLPLLASLILSCVYVAVTRASARADYEPPRRPFYFALGGRELRYFLVRILYGIIAAISGVVVFLGIAAAALAAVAAAQPLDGPTKALVVAPAVAVGLGLFAVWIAVLVRLLPVFAIAAVENRIAFDDAWKMSKGQTLRLLASGVFFLAMLAAAQFSLLLIVILPAAVVLGLIGALAYGVVGASAVAVFAVLALLAVPLVVALIAFTAVAEAAFTARLYAYLSGCGDECKIW